MCAKDSHLDMDKCKVCCTWPRSLAKHNLFRSTCHYGSRVMFYFTKGAHYLRGTLHSSLYDHANFAICFQQLTIILILFRKRPVAHSKTSSITVKAFIMPRSGWYPWPLAGFVYDVDGGQHKLFDLTVYVKSINSLFQ